MNSLLLERSRFVLSLIPQALVPAVAGIVGWYVKLGEARKAIFAIVVDTLADGEAAICTVVEATTAAGGAAQNIATATATATAGTNVTRQQLTMNAPAIGSTVTITVGGVAHVFTAAGAENLVTHAFNQSAGDNATATSLAACINSVLYGVNPVTATVVGPVVILTVDETGDYTITCAVSTPLTIMPVTLEAVVLLEVDGTALTNGFRYVAVRVSGPVTAHAGGIAVLSDLRYAAPQNQPVAAQDWDS
jgi:hypothetical protein